MTYLGDTLDRTMVCWEWQSKRDRQFLYIRKHVNDVATKHG